MKLTQKREAIILQLQKAIEAKSAELEHKNRALEIETALEKVRTVAMAMKKADDMLLICKTISQQMSRLGVKEIRNVQTAIFYERRGTYMNYEYYAKHNRTFITEVDFKNHRIQLSFAKKMMKGPNKEVLEHLKGKKLQDWYVYQKSTNQFADKYLLKAHSLNYYWYSLGPVALGISTYYPLTKGETGLFKRFLKVFELAYRRYLDIEKATAQAKEAQIEAALEKVRSAAMGMHKPDDLLNVCQILFKEFRALGFESLRNAMINIHNDEKKSFINYDYSDEIGGSTNHLVYDIHPLVEKQIQTIRSANDAFSETYFTGRDLVTWKNFRKRIGEKDDQRLDKSKGLYYYFYSIGIGSIGISTFGPIGEESKTLLKRFRNVFSLSYQRYIDIAKAEAQAREAQLEAALERVRAASLAMRDSSALGGIIYKLYGELTRLDAELDRCFIMIVNPENKGITWWMAGQEGLLAENGFFVQMNQHASHLWYLDCWKKRKKRWQYLLEGKEKRDWDRFGFTKTELARLPGPVKKFMAWVKKIHLSGSSDQFGSLVTGSFKPLPDEQQEIINRFAVAFNQAYIRFLDLQKAEAQAREAQIEAALERVRSRAMAMHTSAELKEVALELRKQMGLLGQKDLEVCAIHLYDEEHSFESWSAMKVPDSANEILQTQARFPKKGIRIVDELIKKYSDGEKEYVIVNTGAKSVEWFSVLKEYAPGLYASIIQGIGDLPLKKLTSNWSVADFSGGALVMVTYGEPDPASRNLLRRSANVFEQAYIRFLDLKKAEAQAREAQIEAALERVRSRSLAMHHSSELSAVVDTLLREFTGLEFTLTFCIINLINEEDRSNTVWAANPETGKDPESYYMKFEDYPFHHAMWKAWKAQDKRFVYTIEGEEKKIYDKYLYTETEFSRFPENVKQANRTLERYVAGFTFFRYSGLQTVSVNPITEPELEILERFGRVFEQSYTRFLDLQKAEAQAKEAQIEAALEKVRSRTMAMQSSNELQETAAVLFTEFKKLGTDNVYQVTIGIYNEEEGLIDFRVTSWDGSGAQENRSFQLDMNEPTVLKPAVEAWKANKKSMVFDLSGEKLEGWLNYRNKMSGIAVSSADTAGRRVITVAYYSKGHLTISTPVPVPADTQRILERFAAVFDSTYTRFLDLKKAEAQALRAEQDLMAIKEAKQKAEEALAELQTTQKQLIQAEKMASLGELTAGIAHEIQNPLNFVNNFSEVSKELLDDMKEAIEKGDAEEAKEIMNDVIQNLEKINHHGKRADGIVKGMLQHSRSSSGVKEPTDINALADEYLRLAYHGLRAKDKSFNATLKTEFDDTIGKINVIPQDLGRVILNLITNAFYVVDEKKKQQPAGYEPAVTVTTRKINRSSGEAAVVISVKDNGSGVPQHVIDKIFQPFFTTKPTGQGTGLGLSLSYDIVKAHGGELRVETKEGEGTEFIIYLPVI